MAVRALGAAELTIGASAAVSPTALTAALVAAAYGAFATFVLVAVRSGRTVQCGCFGAAGADAGLVHAVLNGTACAVAITAVLAPPPGASWIVTHDPLVAVPLVLGMVAAAVAAYLAFTVFPTAWHSYGAGRR